LADSIPFAIWLQHWLRFSLLVAFAVCFPPSIWPILPWLLPSHFVRRKSFLFVWLVLWPQRRTRRISYFSKSFCMRTCGKRRAPRFPFGTHFPSLAPWNFPFPACLPSWLADWGAGALTCGWIGVEVAIMPFHSSVPACLAAPVLIAFGNRILATGFRIQNPESICIYMRVWHA